MLYSFKYPTLIIQSRSLKYGICKIQSLLGKLKLLIQLIKNNETSIRSTTKTTTTTIIAKVTLYIEVSIFIDSIRIIVPRSKRTKMSGCVSTTNLRETFDLDHFTVCRPRREEQSSV